MNWLKRIFNWRKAPKATNEIKPVDMDKYTIGFDPINVSILKPIGYHIFENGTFISDNDLYSLYNKVRKSWKRSPKNYSLYYNIDSPSELKVINNNSICRTSFQSKNNVVVGNLYALYQQYYGKENKS